MTELAADWSPSRNRFRSGGLVGSRYRLEGLAGSGGMAAVWLAHDTRLQRPVAIKVIADALVGNPAALARFAHEARTHAGIQHPNLVRLYDYSVTSAPPYLVMEFVNGCTLSLHLDRRAMTPAAIRTLATELLSAVACVHDHGILHRDIKCGNVLMDDAGHARLTDFGLARFEHSPQITRANEVVGTLRFLAPELIEGKPATRQSDLYALGILLRTTARQTALPDPLPRLIRWLTESDANARPNDAHAVLAVLRGDEQQEPRVRARRGGPRTTRRYMSSHPLRGRTAALSALVLAVGATSLAAITAAGSAAPARTRPVASAVQSVRT